MRIWLITIGEPLPTDDGNERLLRTGIVAGMLARRGHDVVWWTSAFNHSLKTFRATADRTIAVEDNLRIELLHGGGYRRNISLQRWRDHRRLATGFRARAEAAAAPDVIVCALPPLELSVAAASYGRARGVPVILDVRDLWPDVFAEVAPRVLRPIARAAIRPLRGVADRACSLATFIWGHAPEFVEWGLRHAHRPRREYDLWFPHGYEEHPPDADAIRAAEAMWDSHDVRADPARMNVCFAGTLGHQFDFPTVFDAAERLAGTNIRFVFCGRGDRERIVERQAARLRNVVFAGWRQRAEIWTLLRRASIGLAPYVERHDFVATIPNKAPEYFSGGVPVALSLGHGLLFDLITSHQCGFSYGGDGARLASRLSELAANRTLLQTMATNARRLFENQFRAETVYGRMIDVLEEIVSESRVSPGRVTPTSAR